MPQKTYLMILKTGIYLSFISVFLVFKNLLFPYITSKQIYFNILIEILFIFWLIFIIQYPAWRPKKSWITIGLIGFFIAITISCFTGVDFNLSFWGDIERMLGVFHVLHFLVFYFIIITIMKSWKDWRNLFLVSIVAATFISLHSIFKTPWSTIGNSAYVSGYLIFNIYFSLILFFRFGGDNENIKKNWWFKSMFLAAIFIMLIAFEGLETSGAYVGLTISIIVLLLLYGILNKNKQVKLYSIISFLIIASFVIFVFTNKDSSLVKNNNFLRKVTSNISFQKVTFQTRLISWRAAAKDFKNHPVLGTGHGNYAIIFDKYFDPSFYNYSRTETYFDRAHNNLIDIASTTGITGLLTYLSIFIAVAYYLIKGYRKNKINIHEFILLTCLIVAYFIQNLAVFDSLVTYISLMMTFGYIFWLSARERDETSLKGISSHNDRPFNNKEVFILVATGLVMLVILFQYNIRPLQMLKGTIDGQMAFAHQDIITAFNEYQKALSNETVLDRDSRDSFVRSVAPRTPLLEKIDREKAQEILDYTIEMSKKNLEYNPKDSLMQMELAQILNVTARFNQETPDKFYYYSDQALEAINRSIEASPGRINVYFVKAQIQATRDENDKAIETLQYAVGLNEKYYDSYCNLAKYHFAFQQQEEGLQAMEQCLDLGGAGLLSPADYVANLINHYITEKEDWPRVLILYQRMSQLQPKEPKIWVNLAKLYAQVGEIEKAIEAAQKSAEIDPGFKDAVEEFIRELQ